MFPNFSTEAFAPLRKRSDVNQLADSNNLDDGAFCLLDCLGFKETSRRYSPEDVIASMLKIEHRVHELIESSKDPWGVLVLEYLTVHIALLSDTVAVSVKFSNPKEHTRNETKHRASLVGYAVSLVGEIIDLFLESEPSFALRGCLTFGSHIAKGNFLAGPAVDQAAELMEIADGAFVWLTPQASELFEQDLRSREAMTASMISQRREIFMRNRPVEVFMKYLNKSPVLVHLFPMPLTNGQSIDVSILNPLIPFGGHKNPAQIIEKYKAIMGSDRLNVWIKWQNTQRFLAHAERMNLAFDEELRKELDLAVESSE